MNKLSICLMRTPFQLFNCIEAIKRFNTNGSNILICIYKNEVDKNLFEEISKELFWEKVYFLKLNFFNKIFYSFILSNILRKYKDVEFCFFGLITSYIIHSVNQINAKNNILIDDGNEIFLIANDIKNDTYKNKFQNILLNRIRGLKFNLDFIDKLRIFTFFDLNSYSLNNEIIKNDYSEFKKLINNLPQDNEIFFIGSNLINSYIKKEYFEEILKNTIKYFKEYKIIYVPHRYEDIDYLKELSIKGAFELKKFPTILELAIFKHQKKPLGLITIRSTALETLGYLYDIKFLNIIKLDKTQLQKESQIVEYENLYKNYIEKKINILSLEDLN